MIGCILAGSIFYYNFMDSNIKSTNLEKSNIENENNKKGNIYGGPSEGIIEIHCDLPTNRPALPDLVLPSDVITSENEAYDFAIQYFPEFEKCELIYTEQTDSDVTTYIFRIGNDENNYEFLKVSSSGTLIYSRESNGELLEDTEFTEDDALTIANSFISNHGGLGDFVFELIGIWGTLDEYGNKTGIIRAYFIDYLHYYDVEHLELDPPFPNDEVPIHGGDGIRMTVSTDEGVSHFLRLHRTPNYETNLDTIISASDAYDSLQTVWEGYGDLDITNVDICYYSERYDIVQETMQPAWRFEYYVNNDANRGDNFIYVNARNGEVI